MKKIWKIIFGVLIVLVVAGFVAVQAMKGLEVEVMKVGRGDIVNSFTEEGVVASSRERTLYSLYTAPIEGLLVEEGDRVNEGDLLVTLDYSELSYTLQELQAQLRSLEGERLKLTDEPGAARVEGIRLRIEQAEDNLESAEDSYNRLKELYEKEAISRVELEEAEELKKQAENNLAQQEKALEELIESYDAPRGSREIIDANKSAIQAQIDLIKYQVDKYQIKAPISGIITDLEVEEGEVVVPQAPLMRLFQQDNYQVETRVLARDIYDISEGMPVNLTLELRNEDIEFSGEVTEISPYAEKSLSPLGLEEERIKVTVLPDIPEGVNVAPGYKLDVEFVTEKRSGQLVVPRTVIFTYQGEDALFVVEEGRAEVRPVTTGLETRQEVVVTEGLQEGELVILNPQRSGIDKGVRVSYTY